MRPLSDWSVSGLVGVFTDIDDTLTTEGQLTAEAYAAIEKLHKAGLKTIPITGRPAGWCDHIARMWPVTLTYFCYGWCLWLYLSFLLIFFKDKFSLSTSESALFATIVYTIGAVGNTVGGIVSDHILHTSTNIRRARVGAAVFGFVGALLSLMEPMMIVVLGVVVGGMVVAMYLPIFDLISKLT